MKLRGMKCLQISGMKGERQQSGKKGVNAVKAKYAKSKITKHSAIIIIYKKLKLMNFIVLLTMDGALNFASQ